MANWVQKAGNFIEAFKHFRTLNNLGHGLHDLANGDLTILGFGNTIGQRLDNDLLKEGFEKNAQAYSIIRKIAETGSDITWLPKLIEPDGTLTDIKDGPFSEFVMQPNEDQTQKEFKEVTNTYMLTTGDVFWKKPEIIGFATRNLRTLPSQLIEVLTNRAAPLTPIGYKLQFDLLKEAFTLDEIIHIKYLNPSTKGIRSLRGLSPLAAAWLVLSSDNQSALAKASMMQNRGAAGFFTTVGLDNPLTPEEQLEQQKLLDDKIGGAKNFNSIIATKSDGKFIQLGMSPSDLEMLKFGIQDLRTLCNVYGAPSELFNDPANKTFANQKTALKAFYENAVLPLDRRLLSKYNSTVVAEWSKADNKNYTVVQDLSKIGALQEDEEKKAERAKKITESIIKVVSQIPNGLTPAAAASIIAHAHDMSEEDARKFVTLNRNGNED